MKTSMVIAALATSISAIAATAHAEQKCFDKGTLTYFDCPKEEQPVVEAEPVAPPPPSWTGFYAGAHAGYAWASFDGALSAPGGPLATEDLDADGFLAGGQLGYLYQFENNVVLGLEIDGSAVWADESVSGDIGVAAPLPYDMEAELDWLASARARLGYAADNVMPYLTGGVALAGWDGSVTYLGGASSFDETSFGGVVGGGVELLADENWLVRAEGLYYFFDDDVSGPLPQGATGTVSLDDVIVGRIGLSYKF